MAQQQIIPTKGNLIVAKRSLQQSKLGFELMDRKRNILIRELVSLTEKANQLHGSIDTAFAEAYASLARSNMMKGVYDAPENEVAIEESVQIRYRSVMGVELPMVSIEKHEPRMEYSVYGTNSQFDQAYLHFNKVKEMIVLLSEIENSIYALAIAIKKTQKRANALKNILIPKYTEQVAFITNALEEKEREEFSRQKLIKAAKEKATKKMAAQKSETKQPHR